MSGSALGCHALLDDAMPTMQKQGDAKTTRPKFPICSRLNNRRWGNAIRVQTKRSNDAIVGMTWPIHDATARTKYTIQKDNIRSGDKTILHCISMLQLQPSNKNNVHDAIVGDMGIARCHHWRCSNMHIRCRSGL
jgi:hypothetical protein